jgi:hypothetical protein
MPLSAGDVLTYNQVQPSERMYDVALTNDRSSVFCCLMNTFMFKSDHFSFYL